MKKFYPTYLYVKTHSVTGLKYFGKTTKDDPHTYKGSGLYWIRHCKKHGWDYKTRVIGYYQNAEVCKIAAIRFSNRHKIVTATDVYGKKLWANAIIENGLDGGATTFGPRSKTVRRKISESHLGKIMPAVAVEKTRIALTGRSLTEEHKENIRIGQNKPAVRKAKKLALTGRILSKETIEKIRIANTGQKRSEDFVKLCTGKRHTKASIKKMSAAQLGKVLSIETKQKIREARKHQIFSDETRLKLSGNVVVVDRKGKAFKIPRMIYFAQKKEPVEKSRYVAHRSFEGIRRLENAQVKPNANL